MQDTPQVIHLRATALVSANSGQSCVVLHRADQIFDLVRFNQQNAVN